MAAAVAVAQCKAAHHHAREHGTGINTGYLGTKNVKQQKSMERRRARLLYLPAG